MTNTPEGMARLDMSNMGMNTDSEVLLKNIDINIRRQLPQCQAYEMQDTPIAIVAGGPSLRDTRDELKAQYDAGVKLVAVNGTHDWLIANDMLPSVMVMVDGRESNHRFVQHPVETCKYLIASQCAPEVFDALDGQDVYIWHAANDMGENAVLNDYYLGNYPLVVGGSTVTLRAIWLMRMLGFRRMDVYGFDSCYVGDAHHAYPQPENDGSEVRKVWCAGKEFQCAAWQVSQAEDFMQFAGKLGDHFELNVHGDGLIAHIIKRGAEFRDQFHIRER